MILCIISEKVLALCKMKNPVYDRTHPHVQTCNCKLTTKWIGRIKGVMNLCLKNYTSDSANYKQHNEIKIIIIFGDFRI